MSSTRSTHYETRWSRPKSWTEFELPPAGGNSSELSVRFSSGETTRERPVQDAGRHAVLRTLCSLLAATMPPEGLEEVVEHLGEAYAFHLENRRLLPSSRQEVVTTKAVASGRIHRPALVLRQDDIETATVPFE